MMNKGVVRLVNKIWNGNAEKARKGMNVAKIDCKLIKLHCLLIQNHLIYLKCLQNLIVSMCTGK